jgi:hypothetical protein
MTDIAKPDAVLKAKKRREGALPSIVVGVK